MPRVWHEFEGRFFSIMIFLSQGKTKFRHGLTFLDTIKHGQCVIAGQSSDMEIIYCWHLVSKSCELMEVCSKHGKPTDFAGNVFWDSPR